MPWQKFDLWDNETSEDAQCTTVDEYTYIPIIGIPRDRWREERVGEKSSDSRQGVGGSSGASDISVLATSIGSPTTSSSSSHHRTVCTSIRETAAGSDTPRSVIALVFEGNSDLCCLFQITLNSSTVYATSCRSSCIHLLTARPELPLLDTTEDFQSPCKGLLRVHQRLRS